MLVRSIELGKSKGIFSILGLVEILTRPKKLNDQAMVDFYKNTLGSYQYLKIVSIDDIIAERAAELRAEYNLRTPDAIHVATAITERADVFITNDMRLKRVKAIPVMTTKELELNGSNEQSV